MRLTQTRSRIVRRAALLAAASALSLASGCYTTGLRFPPHVHRVAVPIFGNETYVRGVELDLTERVRQILLEQADITIAPTEQQADASIRGRVLRMDFPVLVANKEPRILEGSSEMEVEAELVEPRTGRVLARVRGRDRAEYTVPLGETRESATAELIDQLAWKIVLGLAERADDPKSARADAASVR